MKGKKRPEWKRLSICFVFAIVVSFLLTGAAPAMSAKQSPVATTDLPFVTPQVKAPQFPNNTFNIKDYGAVGDGHTKNTDAFAKAIQACVDAGGGRVIVPDGFWLTGPIRLKSNLNLHLEKGALIQFTGDFEDYPLVRKTWEGLAEVRCTPPLYGVNLENVAITGYGIIDGAGEAWRPVKRFKMTDRQWRNLLQSGGAVSSDGRIWWPSEGALHGAELVEKLNKENAPIEEYAAAREYLRPVMVGLTKCKNVLLDGPTFQNSPAWNIHPLMCENMIIRNINVRNPWWSQNGDGLDLESCRNVIVTNCRFDVGDDAICMKSGKNEYGRKRGIPTQNVAVSDCIVYHGHGGFVIGSEMSGGIRDIYIRDCVFLGTDVGLRFKSTRGRGGVVENIYIQNIDMKNIPTDAVRFNMFYEGDAPSPEKSTELPAEPVSEETPSFRKIYMKNIICNGAHNAVYMQGLPEMPIKDIEMENVIISADNGVTCIEADRIKFKNVTILPEQGPAFGFYNSRNIDMQDITFPPAADVFVKLYGDKTQNIHIKDADASEMEGKIEFGKGVESDDLKIDSCSKTTAGTK